MSEIPKQPQETLTLDLKGPLPSGKNLLYSYHRLWIKITSQGLTQKIVLGIGCTKKCDHDYDQALKKAAGDLYRV